MRPDVEPVRLDPVVQLDRLLVSSLVLAFLLAVFFPYVQLVPLGTDTQPYALLGGALIFAAAAERRMPLEIALLLATFGLSLIVVFLHGLDFDAVRSVANYASLFLITFATYHLMRRGPTTVDGALRAAIHVWFGVGLIQTLVYADFLVGLVGRGVGTAGRGGRGVLGLAPEPTHYGVLCIFLLLALVVRGSRDRRLYLLLLVQILVFARSAMAVFILLLIGFIYLCVHFLSARRFLAGLLVLALVAVSFGPVMQFLGPHVGHLRMYRLLHLAVENPALLLIMDHSVNERFFHMFLSLHGFVTGWFLPRGYSAWLEYLYLVTPQFAEYATRVTDNTRIMSGYGAALFELGFLGLTVPVAVTVAAYRYAAGRPREFLFLALSLHAIMLTSVPIGFPPFAFLVGLMAYEGTLASRRAAMTTAPARPDLQPRHLPA